jgi:uncharacterized membrane protein (DUF4010 family)
MHVFRLGKNALHRAFRERGARRAAYTVVAAIAGFVLGAVVPGERVLVGAAVATLLVIILQVVYSVTEQGERSRSETEILERKLSDRM